MAVEIRKYILDFLGWACVPAACLLGISAPAEAGLGVTSSIDAAAMAAALLAPGMNLVAGSAIYTGASGASGFFTGDTTIFGKQEPVQGVLLTTGDINNSLGPNNRSDSSKDNNAPGSSYLTSLIGGLNTFDASTLTFKITLDPGISGIEWNYVFGSEEYNENVGNNQGALFSDIFSLSLDGTNIALVPGSSTPISINTINNGNPFGTSCTNCQFFRNNPQGTGVIDSQYNGLTTVLKASKEGLRSRVEYTLSFSIADATDGTFDSGVFIASAAQRTPDAPNAASVPGPLPLLGAGTAFGWSRHLRRRVTKPQPQED